MSAETMNWLNNYTLIGFTEKRGNAWHYRENEQGEKSNHYTGAIPVEDVASRLFNFEVIEAPIMYEFDGNFLTAQDRKAMICSDNGDVLGIFKSGYQGHQYRPWLLENVASILDDDLGIGSAGLLKGRAQAWVSVEVPENVTTPEGVEFRPNLLACTSFDGSLATTYKRVVQAIVCDNTLSAGLSEDGQSYKLRHSKYSGMKIQDARDALAIVHTMADDFSAEVARLCGWKISDKSFQKLLDTLIPVPEDSKTGVTVATKKRDEIAAMYANDERAATWHGTAFGVLQAFNTWNHHTAQVRKGIPRHMRNMENVLKGKFSEADAGVLTTLATITKHK